MIQGINWEEGSGIVNRMWLILMDNVWDGGCLEVYFVFV